MSQIKTNSEIAHIARACNITDTLFKKILKHISKHTTEAELASYIRSEISKLKLKPSFPPIVTSGTRAGNEIHPQPTDQPLRGFVIIDFGVVYKKYMSDMTRTVYVGTPTKEEQELYQKVLDSQLLGIRLVKHGEKCYVADQAVRAFLGKDAKYFIHTLGHGVGTRIHEAPRIYEKRTKPYFRAGMVITIEPGIYMKHKLGIRIEDTCLVLKDGVRVLTRSPKQLIVVKG